MFAAGERRVDAELRQRDRFLPIIVMDMPSSSIRDLARRLLAVEAATPPDSAIAAREGGHEAVRVCEKLRISLTRFAGADGFASLLRRTLALARVEVPSLNRITVKPDCSMDGLK